MPRQTPNKLKMDTAVAHWIATGSAQALEARAAWIDEQMAGLARELTPAHLLGLTAFDLVDARDTLMAAAVRKAA